MSKLFSQLTILMVFTLVLAMPGMALGERVYSTSEELGIEVPYTQGDACFNVEKMGSDKNFLSKAEAMRQAGMYFEIIERESLWRIDVKAGSTSKSRWAHDFSEISAKEIEQIAQAIFNERVKKYPDNYYDESKLQIINGVASNLKFIYFQEECPVIPIGAADAEGRAISGIPNFADDVYLTNAYCITIYNGKEIWFEATPVEYGDMSPEHQASIIGTIQNVKQLEAKNRPFVLAILLQERYVQIIGALFVLAGLLALNGKAKREAQISANATKSGETEKAEE